MVQADSLGYYDQPGRELAPAIGSIGPEPSKIVRPKLLQNTGVSVHHGVVAAAERASNIKDEFVVRSDKLRPGFIGRR